MLSPLTVRNHPASPPRTRRHACPDAPLTYALSALLGSSLALGALPGGALAADPVDAPIENPDLARPTVASGARTWRPAAGTDQNTQLFSAALANHGGLQAAALARRGAAGTLSTRLWRVQKGSQVTVTWDGSPSPLTNCGTDDPTKGQQYRVSVTGGEQDGASQNFTTETTTVGKVNWHAGRSYSFTAPENNPQISWAYQKMSSCGPLVTHFRATQNPAPVPYDIKKARLPMPPGVPGTQTDRGQTRGARTAWRAPGPATSRRTSTTPTGTTTGRAWWARRTSTAPATPSRTSVR
ncbi:hypothetical protein LT493_08895 [Streptomyces tricolor]|nr:hypothetical protein [Streptomyces tricolor]